MKVIADLHIHSSYSRATSSRLSLPYLERWAGIKGIGLLGTGDCTHPAWLADLRRQTDDAEDGLFTLKKEERESFEAGPAMLEGLPSVQGPSVPGPSVPGQPAAEKPRFILTGEISTIYKKGDKTRKIHHLIILPDFKAAAAFNTRLEGIGANIRSDGRPIIGIDSRDLLSMLLDVDERAMLIPAHIWTPWFSVLGAKSGFDSIEECYGELADSIPAIETGLSSNPPMNWALSRLDRYSIISNSDAHSPDKLGREATIFDMELSYPSLRRAMFQHSLYQYSPRIQPEEFSGEPLPCSPAILGTIEFFPQEGKYHYDGHRNCEIVLDPEEAAAGNHLCPVCGKPLTRGVMGRVLELADRQVNEEEKCPDDYINTNRRPYYSLIPLRELCAELLGTGPSSKKTETAYFRLIEKGGSELSILMDRRREDLEKLTVPELSGEILAEAIMKMRSGEVSVSPGYDGEYGTVRVFASAFETGKDLFGEIQEIEKRETSRKSANMQNEEKQKKPHKGTKAQSKESISQTILFHNASPVKKEPEKAPLDTDQEKAVAYNGREIIIIAGPGTGKTVVLTARIARIINEGADPASILAMTFTVKASSELKERINRLSEEAPVHEMPQSAVTAATFHSFCCSVLREHASLAGISPSFGIMGGEERDSLLREIGGKQARRLGSYIEERKRCILLPGDEFKEWMIPPGVISPADAEMETLYAEYRNALKKSQSLDYEDLTAGTVRLLASNPEILKHYHQRFRHIFVDEYQDINFSQYILIRLLAPGGKTESPSLCVIGDPNQAIYGFRGSDKRFIDRFLSDYPDAGRFELSRSFRCAEPIINAAGKLTGVSLQGNAPENPAAVSLYRTQYPTEKSEAESIARIISALIGGTSFFAIDSNTAGNSASGDGSIGPGDCAVLVRTAALASPIIKALEDHGIPYELTGESAWWKEEPAATLLDVLREGEKWKKHSEKVEPLTSEAAAAGISDEKAASHLSSPAGLIKAAWEELSGKGGLKNEEGESLMKRNSHNHGIDKLIGLAGFFRDLPSLLDTLDSCAVSGIPEPGSLRSIQNSGVKVMTIHASKGLEFEQVFAAGLEEGILPFTLFGSNSSEEQIEEERRLLYVAMTRAKQGLWLSWAESRMYNGRKLSGTPSRFLAELETMIPLYREDGSRKKEQKWDGQLNLF